MNRLVSQWQQKLPDSLVHIVHFLRLLISRFIQDQGLPSAASLTFTTLLSLVPLMTVSLAIFTAFPIAEQVAEQIQDFIFENFVPASSEVLQEHFINFSSQASRLTGPGFVFLIVVALMLMANIDRAFNTIWRVRRKRGPLGMFVVYWSILSLGPVLIVVDGSGVRIVDSRCPHKLCVRMGAINHAGDWIACVPNKLVIRIEGDSAVDAITPGGTIP